MSIKISELPQASTVNNTDVIPIVQGGTTKQATAGMIRPTVATSITSSSTNNEVAGAKAVYDYARKDVIDLTNPNEFNIQTTHVYFTPAFETYALIGDKLSVDSNNKVVIGAGVSIVKAYCYASWAWVNTSDNKYMRIIQNGTTIRTGKKYMTNTAVEEIQFQACIKVNEGDIIALEIYGNAGDNFPINRVNFYVEVLEYGSSTISTNSLNTTRLMNTGSLVGLGDRAELANELTDNNVGDTEQVEKQVEQVEEKVENISTEPIETKTEGSGDTK